MLKINLRVRWSSLVLLLFFSYDLIYPLVSRVIGNTSVASLTCDGILLLVLIIAVGEKKKRLKYDSILVILFSALTFIITLFLHPEYKNVMLNNNSFGIFKMVFILHGGVFSYIFLRLEDDPYELLNSLKIATLPIWICYTLKTIGGISFKSVSVISGRTILRNYNQAYGYAFLFVLIMCTYMFLKEKKKWCIVGIIITLVQIIRYASRTALLAYGMYIVLYLLFDDTSKVNMKKKIVGSSFLIVFLYVMSSKNALAMIGQLCSQLGLSSRIVDLMISGNNDIDGGRIWLWNTGISLIKENPFGLGAYSDHYVMGIYVHNIFIQILMTFGWIIGGVIIFFLIRMVVIMLKSPPSLWKTMFLIFFSLTTVRLMLSYSFWYDDNFWFMLAIYVGYQAECKRRILIINESCNYMS